MNPRTPRQVSLKHHEEEKKRVKSLYPDMGTYDPQAADYLSFGKMLKLKDSGKDYP